MQKILFFCIFIHIFDYRRQKTGVFILLLKCINQLMVFFDNFLHIADYGGERCKADPHGFLLCGITSSVLGFSGIYFFYYSININITVIHVFLVTISLQFTSY